MAGLLDKFAVRLCRDLPLDWTLFEKDGVCGKPSRECNYCRKCREDLYFCNKKTYVFDKGLQVSE